MEGEQRRLAAIVFTDIVGYSSVSQRDEALAMRLLDANNSIVRSAVESHGGREIKTIGDAFLLEFPSALQAVLFAVDAQERFDEFNRAAPAGETVSVRIGVHLGDVISRNGDLFGDAVNIASRVVEVAEGGGVCVTGTVHDQVRNRVTVDMAKLPPQRLKNIESEIDLYRVVLPWKGTEPASPSPASRIAVLPFANISPDPKDGYFADGLTEELITTLSEVHELRVIARTSVDRYRDGTKSAKQIGTELGVSHLLEGSVRMAGNRVKIAAHLVDAQSQEEVWSDRYEDDLVDVFSIQSDIASRVTESLKVRLVTDEMDRIGSRETKNVAAYVAYLKGRSLLRDGTEESVRLARKQFELAIREDENYAKAHAGMADALVLLGDYLFSPVPVAIEEANRYVRKALVLDPNLVEARVSLANLLMFDYKFGDAEREFRRAIEANPSYATGHHWYSICLQCFGRTEDAMRETLVAEDLDPLSASITLTVVYRLVNLGRFEEAMERIRKLEAIDRESPLVDETRMVYNFVRRDWESTTECLKRMMERDPADPYLEMDMAYIYGVTGRKNQALELIEKLKKVPEDLRIRGQMLAFAFLGLGDVESAFEWLNYALSKKEFFFSWIRGHPAFEPIRKDPRYRELLEAVGLPFEYGSKT